MKQDAELSKESIDEDHISMADIIMTDEEIIALIRSPLKYLAPLADGVQPTSGGLR